MIRLGRKANGARSRRLDVRFDETVKHALDSPSEVIGLLVDGQPQRERQRIAQRRANELPGADARIERPAKDSGLLTIGNTTLSVTIKSTQDVAFAPKVIEETDSPQRRC